VFFVLFFKHIPNNHHFEINALLEDLEILG